MIVGLEKSNIIKFFTDVVMYRPWWDTLEDNLIYILVMVGLIVVPSAIIMGTPLDCNFCQVDGGGADVKEKNLCKGMWYARPNGSGTIVIGKIK